MSEELDARVAVEVMGVEPERIAIATSDGGESACAMVDWRNGPWRSESELREWLATQQKRGSHKDYEIGEWLRYPAYSTEIRDAWLVVEKYRSGDLWQYYCQPDFSLMQMDRLEGGLWVCQLDAPPTPTSGANFSGVWVKESTAPQAICVAMLVVAERIAALKAVEE